MNIYLIERTDVVGYDEHDAIVVCSYTKEEAIKVSLLNCPSLTEALITCEHVGIAIKNMRSGVILASFNGV